MRDHSSSRLTRPDMKITIIMMIIMMIMVVMDYEEYNDCGEPNSTPNKDNDNDDEKWNISAGDIYTRLVMVMMIWCDRVSVLIYIPS